MCNGSDSAHLVKKFKIVVFKPINIFNDAFIGQQIMYRQWSKFGPLR